VLLFPALLAFLAAVAANHAKASQHKDNSVPLDIPEVPYIQVLQEEQYAEYEHKRSAKLTAFIAHTHI
jgi:hypothetical protein